MSITVTTPSSDNTAQSHTEMAFIDTSISGWGTLRDSVLDGVEVVLLDSGTDGLAQMAAVLRNIEGLSAIHVLSHGTDAKLHLGSLSLSAENLDAHAGDLATLGRALGADGALLLYGCDLASTEAGTLLIERLAEATGVDVAASADASGAAALVDDWMLESSAGDVLDASAFTEEAMAGYASLFPIVAARSISTPPTERVSA